MKKGFHEVFNYISDSDIFIETGFNKQELTKTLDEQTQSSVSAT